MSLRSTILVAALSSVVTVGLLLALVAGAGPTLAGPASDASSPANPVVQTNGAHLNTASPATEEGNAPDPEDLGQAPVLDAQLEDAGLEAGPRYLHISGSVFIPLYAGTEFAYGGSGCTYVTGGGNPYLNYPVILPYDATVNQLRLYFKDTNAGANSYFWLARYDDGLSYTYVVTATTTGSAGWGTATVSLNHQLDYDNYSYAVVWSQPAVGATLQVCGFRIGYTAPGTFGSALPLISKDHTP